MANVKIVSDPYNREITYYSLNDATKEWQPIDADNEAGYLRSVEYKKSFLPFRINDIIDIIIAEYGANNETIEIEFQGTNEEFKEVKKVCRTEHYKDKVVLQRSNIYLENARSILTVTKDLFGSAKPIIEKIVQDDEIVQKNLKKVSDALDDIIPICVFGNYSSGKSTFINALIGSEILPSGGDPVTAKIYEIKRSAAAECARIQFTYGDTAVDMSFDDGTYRIVKEIDDGVFAQLERIVQDSSKENLSVVINKVLEFLNAYPKEESSGTDIGSMIRVEVPFSPNGVLGQSQNNFVIFDTPGSNSASNAEHSMVLEEALQGFSNGIPVWVSQYDSIDSEDNAALCNRILNIEALDNRFTMIVLNKADSSELPEEGFTAKQEQNILEYSSVEKMYAAGIFFVSAIMGLGAKNEGTLQDKYYRKIYRRLKEIYIDSQDEDYTILYQYNIMPKQIKEELSNSCSNQTNIVYANSGLYCVEKEIEDFASKYSAYNKCKMVYSFLDSVITETSRRIASRTDSLKRRKEIREKELDAKKQDLIVTIRGINGDKVRKFRDTSKKYVRQFAGEELQYTCECSELEALDNRIANQHSKNANFEIRESVYEKSKDMRRSHVKDHFQRLLSKDFKQAFIDIRVDYERDSANVQAAKEERKSAKQEIDNKTSDDVLDFVIEHYRDDFMDAKQRLSTEIKAHWQNNVSALKENLVTTVTDSDALLSTQREQLAAIIMDFRPLEFSDKADSVFIKTKFLRGTLFSFVSDAERLNIGKLASRYNNSISEEIESMAQMINESCYASFKSWSAALMSVIEENITEYNPQLRDMAMLIKEESDKIIELEEDQRNVTRTFETIKQLMTWKDVDFEEM